MKKALLMVMLMLFSYQIHADNHDEKFPKISLSEQKELMEKWNGELKETRNPELRKKLAPADWIEVPYHGLLLDANLEVIKMDEKTAEVMLDSLFEILLENANPEALSKYKGDLKELYSIRELKDHEKLLLKAVVNQAVLEVSSKKVKKKYHWRYRLIRDRVNGLVHYMKFDYSDLFRELMERYRLPHDWWRLIPTKNAYIEDCKANGVPIPPDWPSNDWVSQGQLNFTFISQGATAEVYAYNDPNVAGACYALPRTRGNNVSLLGIICQSAQTGKACFWDNRAADGSAITGSNVQLDIDQIQNGSNLSENCTACHRGDNVFLIHPGTALQLPAPYQTSSQVRYSPIGQPHWNNPPNMNLPALNNGQQSCSGCHGIPMTNPSYCGLLRQSLQRTMPPGGVGGQAYSQHSNFLRNQCP